MEADLFPSLLCFGEALAGEAVRIVQHTQRHRL